MREKDRKGEWEGEREGEEERERGTIQDVDIIKENYSFILQKPIIIFKNSENLLLLLNTTTLKIKFAMHYPRIPFV